MLEIFQFPDISAMPDMLIAALTRILIAAIILIAGLLSARLLASVVGRMVLSSAESRASRTLSQRRAETITRLAIHLTFAVVVVVTAIIILSLFVDSTGLLTFLGLFSAAFGLGARPLVSDYLSGMIFLFEDQYNVGEKVEIFGIEGTVIDVNLRTTTLRSPSGEIYIIPNGEVRVVRNFGRGEFSLASIRVTVPGDELDRALKVLEELAPGLSQQMTELLETPRILSEDGAIGDRVDLTVFAKAKFGQGADARRKLLSIISDALQQSQVNAKTPSIDAPS